MLICLTILILHNDEYTKAKRQRRLAFSLCFRSGKPRALPVALDQSDDVSGQGLVPLRLCLCPVLLFLALGEVECDPFYIGFSVFH